MKVTFVPENYSTSPKTVSVSMSQKDEQELMDIVEVVLLFKTIWDAASKGSSTLEPQAL